MEKYNKYNIQAAHNILNGKYHFSKKYSIIALNQNIPALYYVLKGSGILWIDKIKYDITEMQSIFVRPNVEATFECGDDNCELLYVFFTGVDYMWLISHTAFTSGLYVTPPIELPDVEKLFKELDTGNDFFNKSTLSRKVDDDVFSTKRLKI